MSSKNLIRANSKTIPVLPGIMLVACAAAMLIIPHDKLLGRTDVDLYYLIPIILGFSGIGWFLTRNFYKNIFSLSNRKEILKHQKRLERTQHLAHIAFFEYSWQKNRFDVSRELNNILEVEEEYESLIHLMMDKIFPDDLVRIRSHAFLPHENDSVRRGELEFRIIGRNGRIKYLFAQYEHHYNLIGHRIISNGWVQDITAHRVNEMALAESEEKYRNMFALESDALFLCDNDTGDILETNAAASKLFGYYPPEFKAIKIYNLMENAEKLKENLRRHHEHLVNVTLRKKGSETFTAMVSLAYFIWKGRNVHLAAIRDITKILSNEKELELTKFSLDHAALMVYVLRKDGTFHYINEALYKTLRYSREELLGMKIFDIETDLTPEEYLERWNELKKARQMHVKKSHTSKDGTVIPCEVITNYLIVSGTEYKVAFVQDIRTRIELEEQIKHSEKMNAVGQLAGGIAHDFNNQLMGISGYAYLLRDKIRDNKLLNYVENIIKATEHSADLTKKLLAFSRKGKYISVVINAHEIIDECVMLLKPGLGKQVEIVVDDNAENPMVEGDTSSIQNAILNIAINAKDAMFGHGKMTIATRNCVVDEEHRINKLSEGEYLAISISDTGTGISPDIREKIFEPFFSTKDSGQGTGLGLSATIGTIQAHNGTVVVESSPGEGSTFTIFLPSCHQEKAANYVIEKETVYGEGVIMLVDDEEVVREVTRLMITKLGYNVVAFSDGNSSIDYYKKHGKNVAAVILDLIMPGMSGYDVFKELQKINDKVQVLLFSGFSTNDEAQRALDMGAAGYLQKPARIEKLSKELIKIAGRSRFYEHETSEEDWSGQFPQDEAINIPKALKLVNDDRSLLKQIFRNFHKKYHTVPDTLLSQAKKNSFADLYLNMHSMKTLFGNMGAEELFLFAEKLEKMIDVPEPVEIYSNRYFMEFIHQLKKFILVLENWDGLKDDQKNQQTEEPQRAINKNPEQAIAEILEMIQQYSPANTKRIKDIIEATRWPEESMKEITEIAGLLEDYDFEDAGIKAKNIQSLIQKTI